MPSCGSNTYGIHKESLERIHIESAVNGLKCNCVCPACQADLIARNNGKKRTPHFAHASSQACQWAGETDVHLMAKQILSENMWLNFPAYRGCLYQVNLEKQKLKSVECEPFINGKRPDCVGVWRDENGKEIDIWIEIKVTHPVDDSKLELIKQQGISCIEIDLKQYANLHELTPEFEEAILITAGRTWLNAPFLDEIDRQKIKEAEVERKKRNENLRIVVAQKLKSQFDSQEKFEIPIPCLNVCQYKDECICKEAKGCKEFSYRLINLKEYYNQCVILQDYSENKIFKVQNDTGRYEPLYIAVYGEGEIFPHTISDDKVYAVHLTSPNDSWYIHSIENHHSSSYPMIQEPYEYENNPLKFDRHYYNFVKKEAKTILKETVLMKFFVLYESGKWFNESVECRVQFDTKSKGIFSKVFQFHGTPTYEEHLYGIALAIEAGFTIKHCSICKFRKSSLTNKIGYCPMHQKYGIIEQWTALTCDAFERNNELMQVVKADQPHLYKDLYEN